MAGQYALHVSQGQGWIGPHDPIRSVTMLRKIEDRLDRYSGSLHDKPVALDVAVPLRIANLSGVNAVAARPMF
jgi:hypothetical protein